MNKLIRKYLQYAKNEKENSENTIKNYEVDLRGFYNFINNKNIKITKVKPEHIIKYKEHMKNNKKWASATRSRKITALREFYKYLFENGYIAKNPMNKIAKIKIPERNPEFLTIEEARKLLLAAQGQKFEKRDKAILLLFLTTGIRVSELAKIRCEHIKENTLTVIGKRNKERQVSLPTVTINALNDYLKAREGTSKYLFISNKGNKISVRGIQYIVDKYLNLAGLNVKKYSVHTLRHTAATIMMKNGTNIRTIQDILGHANIRTTQIYTHVSNDMKQNAAEKMGNVFAI